MAPEASAEMTSDLAAEFLTKTEAGNSSNLGASNNIGETKIQIPRFLVVVATAFTFRTRPRIAETSYAVSYTHLTLPTTPYV